MHSKYRQGSRPMGSVFAEAVGNACIGNHGLSRLILPGSLSSGFKQDVADAIISSGGTAFIVGSADGELGVGEAARFRTNESGDGVSDVVLLATEGGTDELKTNEGFRDLLAFGLPGGLDGRPDSIVRANDLALSVTKLVFGSDEKDEGARNEVAEALEYVFSFLADVYEDVGNEEQTWSSAYWQHLEMACENLPRLIRRAQNMRDPIDGRVVFASAGLPAPTSGNRYDPSNDATKFSKRLQEGWTSLDTLEMSIVSIDAIDGSGDGDHSIMQLDWNQHTASRTNYGHPVLAAMFHGSEGMEWVDAWLNCSETGFFTRPNDSEPDHELFGVDEAGNSNRLVSLGLTGLDYLLPPAPAGPVDNGYFSIGEFELKLDVQFDMVPASIPFQIQAKPASAALIEILDWRSEGSAAWVRFRMSRKLGASGKWRETPFTLNIEPKQIMADSTFRAGLKLKLLVPHPSRPTVIAAEQSEGSSSRRISHPTTSEFLVEQGNVVFGVDVQKSLARLKLRNPEQETFLYVTGLEDMPTWETEGSPREIDSDYLPACVRVFEVRNLPENATLNLGDYRVEISAPVIEKGQVNPVFAALTGEPLVTPTTGVLNALGADPRERIERWLSESCMSGDIQSQIRTTIGACVLSSPGTQSDTLRWNDRMGAFTDITMDVAFRYPTIGGIDEFWEAFEALNLSSLSGAMREPIWPSTLDLREVSTKAMEDYLDAFTVLMNVAGPQPVNACCYYPFSALLYDTSQGEVEGVLLSPLHPLRLAWLWSVQNACTDLFESGVYKRVATSFLRFVDGGNLPLMGPSLENLDDVWFAVGLSSGPSELFAGWALVASQSMISGSRGRSVSLLGRQLPFGTPSGLDKGSVTVALKDYLRVYPSSLKLRIGLASPAMSHRYLETDEAIIAAATSMLANDGGILPGGIRVLDSLNREGTPPSPSGVLNRVSVASDELPRGARAPFEWTMEPEGPDQGRVDIQFIENSIVRLGFAPATSNASPGTTGPRLPVNRFRVWQRDEVETRRSSVSVAVQSTAFSGLKNYSSALSTFESRVRGGTPGRLMASLSLGHALISDRARWTVTGNRHLDPSVLSAQLRQTATNIALWEWRPAFLKRRQGQSLGGTISSSHPYTVLAKPPRALVEGISAVFESCQIPAQEDDAWQLISQLGMRGVGLSSLLTMGHAQSVGAVGFSMAFNALSSWENSAPENEVRCVLPMDAIYPLLDVLAEGARATDDQKRADLLLLSVTEESDGAASIIFHPVEVKMRSAMSSRFPEFGSPPLNEPLEQLASTRAVLQRATENFADLGSSLVLVNAAMATLLESGLATRPLESPRDPNKEARLLTAVAEGRATVSFHSGTLLWFQSGASGPGGRLFSLLQGRPNSKDVNQVLVNPVSIASAGADGQVQKAISAMLVGGDLSGIYDGTETIGTSPDKQESEGARWTQEDQTDTVKSSSSQDSGSVHSQGAPDVRESNAGDGDATRSAPMEAPVQAVADVGGNDVLTPEQQELRSRVTGVFEGFVGNKRAVLTLRRDLLSAYLSADPDDADPVSLSVSYLLTGPPSTGKTELSRRVARALGLPFVMLDGQAVESRDKLFQFIKQKIEENGGTIRELGIDAGRSVREYPPFIVLIDEVHLMRQAVQEALLTLLEPKDRQVSLKEEIARVPKATFLLATTRASEVDNAFKTRCTEIQLRPYTSKEVAEMLQIAAASHADLQATDIPVEFMERLARVARNVPRIALQLLDELQREIVASTILNPNATLAEQFEAVRAARGIDESGLGPDDIEVLTLLQRQDRPLSESQLLGQLASVDRNRFLEEVAPYLTKIELIKQTGQGRVITDKGRAYLLERSLR